MKNLVIVESPAKAKTIEGFLGKDFTVKSSYGHIRDLPEKELGINIEGNFEPNYIVPADKKALVKELKKLSDSAEFVWLASDEDREGEAIAWHLYDELKIPASKTKRIVFNEITKSAILHAADNPRQLNMNLVNAQQARRILDRLVGYELSPILWRKVKPSLSAGRVQSVSVRLIVERERQIEGFQAVSAFRMLAYFNVEGTEMRAELSKRFETADEARNFIKGCQNATFKVIDLQIKPGKRTPAAPFTTSTLQQEASRKLGFGVTRTMKIAQDLYEQGSITYMRTDSVNLSETALNAAKETVTHLYGHKYAKTQQFSTKSKGAQEAHEAIRPTNMTDQTVKGDSDHKRLYDLVWKRTIASQMEDAILERTTATISVSNSTLEFVAQGEVIKFDGFLKVYMEDTDDEVEDTKGILPSMKVGQNLPLNKLEGVEKFSSPPPRYTEASLVKKLEELGIGRPSTYAPTINTIIKRNYVVKDGKEGTERKYVYILLNSKGITDEIRTEITGAEKAKLFPTPIGKVVTDFLVENFKEILDYHFTAQVEKEFDEIAESQNEWTSMIAAFYKPFHDTIVETGKSSKKATGERLLGVDPVSGRNVYSRLGKYGPMVQIGEAENEEKPKFAGLQPGQTMDDVTLEQALELFKLPREIGNFEGETLIVGIGKFGPYVRQNKTYVSIGEENPMTISLETAIKLIESKRTDTQKMMINEYQDGATIIQVKNGRFGPYIAVGKVNYKIPKNTKPEELTLSDCKTIMEQQVDRPKRAPKRKK